MALMPIVHRTQVNLPKSEYLAGKNLKKVIAAGEGRAQRNLQKLLDRRTSRRNPEKTGILGFF
jgi:aspartate carbamoyltransferase catalytic subunit